MTQPLTLDERNRILASRPDVTERMLDQYEALQSMRFLLVPSARDIGEDAIYDVTLPAFMGDDRGISHVSYQGPIRPGHAT